MLSNRQEKIGSRIRDRLSVIGKRRIRDAVSGEAAILISILLRQSEPRFLLTRRTESVATHKGQISFPGGMRENGDSDLMATALREAEEEIGVESSRVKVLGDFHDYMAVTGQLVRPYAGILPEQSSFRVNQEEVAYLLEVPFSFFVDTVPRIETRYSSDKAHEVLFYDYDGEVIWGLTARIIKDFIDEIL